MSLDGSRLLETRYSPDPVAIEGCAGSKGIPSAAGYKRHSADPPQTSWLTLEKLLSADCRGRRALRSRLEDTVK